MRNLADVIENFIIGELFAENDKFVLLQRNELAERLECAPSQISYAVSTRFTPERGFIVESKRGAGGFIRIVKIQTVTGNSGSALTINNMNAHQIVEYLFSKQLITKRELVLMNYSLECLEGHTSEKAQQAIVKEAYNRVSASVKREKV